MVLKEKKTERGFSLIEFEDLYNHPCSLQKSSLATDDAIWFGCDEGTHHLGDCLARMHLNREQVRELIPTLQHFVETGDVATFEGDHMMTDIELLENIVIDLNEAIFNQEEPLRDADTLFNFGSDGSSATLGFGMENLLDDNTVYDEYDEEDYENNKISYKTLLLKTIAIELERREQTIQAARSVVAEVLEKMVK